MHNILINDVNIGRENMEEWVRGKLGVVRMCFLDFQDPSRFFIVIITIR